MKEYIFEMSFDELRHLLERLGQDTMRLCKLQLQKSFAKLCLLLNLKKEMNAEG